MQTFNQRKAMFLETIIDKELNLSSKEMLLYGYYYIRYEMALRKRAKGRRLVTKYATLLNMNSAIYDLRKSMNNL